MTAHTPVRPRHAGHSEPAVAGPSLRYAEQQYDSAKLGMWIFLMTEVLFFGGLFCAYAVFRVIIPRSSSTATAFSNRSAPPTRSC